MHSPANTVGRCIENIAEDLKKQVLEEMTQRGRFAVKLPESTGVSNMSQLIAFAKFCFSNKIQK